MKRFKILYEVLIKIISDKANEIMVITSIRAKDQDLFEVLKTKILLVSVSSNNDRLVQFLKSLNYITYFKTSKISHFCSQTSEILKNFYCFSCRGDCLFFFVGINYLLLKDSIKILGHKEPSIFLLTLTSIISLQSDGPGQRDEVSLTLNDYQRKSGVHYPASAQTMLQEHQTNGHDFVPDISRTQDNRSESNKLS